MISDKYIKTKWVDLVIERPCEDLDWWNFEVGVGKPNSGPGIWFHKGLHLTLTIWFTSNRGADLQLLCGKCSLCRIFYDEPKRRLQAKWL